MKKLEVSLSKNDLEHIANGYDIKIKIGDRRILEVDEIILKPALTNDIMNPLINYTNKIINTEQVSFASDFFGGIK
ncbi:Uncharacterised protein [Streptococcus pneumoniae]|nr:Uncharacterised protein [Streptococcus pneumoniae]VPU41021.1 Uncharacterised protein [Streptococcus pneumoniae]